MGQANGIDQPSFTATLIKNRSKYNLSARELAWLAGDMLYVSFERLDLSNVF
jgi:hypothetical protein